MQHHKDHLNISEDRGFYKEGEEKENKEIKGSVLESALHADWEIYFVKDLGTGQAVVRCEWSWAPSSQLDIILVLQLKV